MKAANGNLNKIISVVLFVSMAACFIVQTFTQVDKFLEGQVVQGTDTYIPDVVQLPSLIVCQEISSAIDKSLLEQMRLPRSMFNGSPLDLNVVNAIPFPDVWEIWDMVTLDLSVSDWLRHNDSGLKVSEINTVFQGRCYKIDDENSYPGGTKIQSWLSFKTEKRDSAGYILFFAYDLSTGGIAIDYAQVPYEEAITQNRTMKFLKIG